MSSTSNVQDLLVNVFRPTYKYQPGTGFVPSLVLSNVTEIITDKVKTGSLVVSDANVNTYIGSNAGAGATSTASNVAIGYSAMSGAFNSSNNVALGVFALDGVANSSSNVAIGDGADITGRGLNNILIGPNVTMVDGCYNILIGSDISVGSGNYRFQLGTFLYGDLSTGKFGVNTSAPATAFDVSGISYFRGKVGIQNPTPDYSLDVNGSLYVSDRLLVGPGTQSTPIYGFRDLSSGMYQATDASYGTGAVGIAVNSMARLVVASNKTYIYGDLVVEGTGGGGGGGTIASNGTASAPSFTFSNDLSTGLHLVRTSTLAFDTSGVQRMCISGGFVGIGTPTPRVALDVSGDISANVYNGPGGTQTAPHYTFSDDRTTGVFFPGANIVGFTAGGTERMRISNSNVGIGTRAPSNALDVSGTLRVIGVAGDITLTNGAISIAGTPVISSSGVLSNGATTSNSIGGVTLSNSNVIVGGALRNALVPTTWDISGGNLSNSATTRSSNFIGTASASNQIGGITLSNSNVIVGGALRNALVPTTWDISGGNLSNSGTTRSSNFLAGLGATTAPAFAFGTVAGTGLYQASDASYGTGALGVAVNQSTRIVVMSNKTILYGNLDICGTVSAAAGISGGGGGGGGTVATDGSVSAPSFTFSNDSTTGMYLPTTGLLGLTAGGAGGLLLTSNGYLGVAGATPDAFSSLKVGNDYSPGMSVTAANGNVQLMLCNATNSGSSGSKLLFVADNTGNEIRYTGVGGLAIMGSQYPKAAFGNDGTLTINPGSGYAADATRLDVVGNLNLQGTGGGSLTYSGAITGSTSGASNSIGGVTLSNGWISNGFTTENTIGGVTLSAGILSNSSSSVNTIGGVWLSNGVVSNSFSTTNSIGGVTLGYGVVSNSFSTSNSIGGVTLNSGAIFNGIGTNNYIGGVSLDSGAITNSPSSSNSIGGVMLDNGSLYSSSGTNSIGGVTLDSGSVFANSSLNLIGATYLTDVGIGIGAQPSMYQLALTADSAIKPTTNTWATYSDRRIKQNIQRADIRLCYDIVKRLPLQRFTWDASFMPTAVDRNSIGWIAQDVSGVFPNAVSRISNAGFSDFHTLNTDQLYKAMYGALEQVIADKEALEAQVAAQGTLLQTILTRLATLEASPQSSESTQTTPPTPPTPSEPAPESPPEPQQPPSSEYAPAPAETEA